MVVHPLNRQVSVYNAQIEHVCTGFAVCQCCTVVISLSFPHSFTLSLSLPPYLPLSHTQAQHDAECTGVGCGLF